MREIGDVALSSTSGKVDVPSGGENSGHGNSHAEIWSIALNYTNSSC
jgi:hypothetical protein